VRKKGNCYKILRGKFLGNDKIKKLGKMGENIIKMNQRTSIL
jgi:hypothetical protein